MVNFFLTVAEKFTQNKYYIITYTHIRKIRKKYTVQNLKLEYSHRLLFSQKQRATRATCKNEAEQEKNRPFVIAQVLKKYSK